MKICFQRFVDIHKISFRDSFLLLFKLHFKLRQNYIIPSLIFLSQLLRGFLPSVLHCPLYSQLIDTFPLNIIVVHLYMYMNEQIFKYSLVSLFFVVCMCSFLGLTFVFDNQKWAHHWKSLILLAFRVGSLKRIFPSTISIFIYLVICSSVIYVDISRRDCFSYP